MRTVTFISAAAAGLGAAASTHAMVLPPDLTGFNIQIAYASGAWSSQADPNSITSVLPDPEKQGQYQIDGWKANSAFDIWWELEVNTDPFITSSFNVTNVTALPQTFVITVTLPIIPQLPATSAIGDISGSLLDSDFSGFSSVSTVPGVSLYEALIDGATVETLYDDPYTLAIGTPTANLPTAGFGPQLEAGAAATIGIRNTFTLSPGDTFQAVSFFFVNAIPTPGTGAILGLAGLAAARRRR
jgi:hypothetical protein